MASSRWMSSTINPPPSSTVATVPFVFGAVMVAVGVVIMAAGSGVLTRALEGSHETPVDEAEAVLVGDLD